MTGVSKWGDIYRKSATAPGPGVETDFGPGASRRPWVKAVKTAIESRDLLEVAPAQCYGTSSFTVGKYVAYRRESRVRIVIPSTAA